MKNSEALVAKTLPADLVPVLDIVCMVNFLKNCEKSHICIFLRDNKIDLMSNASNVTFFSVS